MITQGARVGRGAVLGEGCILNPGIPVIDAETGEELSRGIVPAWTVGIGATRPRRFAGGEFGLPVPPHHPAARRGQAPRHRPAQRPAARTRRLGLIGWVRREWAGSGRRAPGGPDGDRPAGRHGRARRHRLGQPPRAGHGRPRGAAVAATCRGSRSTGSRTTWWRAPISADQSGIILAGHTDTVPANGNDRARVDGDELWGLGSADMKSGLAVMLELASSLARTGRRSDLRLLRLRGGGPGAQRPVPPVRPAAGPAGGRCGHPGRADGRSGRGRMPGRAQGRGDLARRAGPHRPALDGPERHPPARAAPGGGGRVRRSGAGGRRLPLPGGAAGRAGERRRGRQRGA